MMRKLTAVVIAVGLTAVCFSQGASQPLSQAIVAVNIAVLPYAALNIPVDKLVMKPVTAAMFEAGMENKEKESWGDTMLWVATNTPVRLEVPLTVPLSDSGTYEVDVDVTVWSEDIWPEEDELIQYINLGTGSHQLILHVEIKKVWTMADRAGTYTGTITLNIYTS